MILPAARGVEGRVRHPSRRAGPAAMKGELIPCGYFRLGALGFYTTGPNILRLPFVRERGISAGRVASGGCDALEKPIACRCNQECASLSKWFSQSAK